MSSGTDWVRQEDVRASLSLGIFVVELVDGWILQPNSTGPSDAFEVAVLGASTGRRATVRSCFGNIS